MSFQSLAPTIEFPFPSRCTLGHDTPEPTYDALTVELRAALAREEMLIREKRDLSQRQVMLAQEFEHRLVNSLQSIASLLSLQSRTTTTREAAAQLTIAARRVGALGRVLRRLLLLDHQENVEFKRYLQHLCDDLSGLLFPDASGFAIVVEGADCEIPTVLGIPLGFIVNELITNSAKYTKGNITVRVETTSPPCRSLSVLDDGPGLPAGFDPAKSKGLGIKIVLSLVKQIGGELHILRGDNGRGAHFRVTF
jgi:two-component system, sensor histidine kinase PdtaS